MFPFIRASWRALRCTLVLGFLILQLKAVVRDTLDIRGGAGLRLHAEQGRDRRTQVVLINVGRILSTGRETHRQAHQQRHYATDRAVPQVTDLQIESTVSVIGFTQFSQLRLA